MRRGMRSLIVSYNNVPDVPDASQTQVEGPCKPMARRLTYVLRVSTCNFFQVRVQLDKI